MKKWRLLDTGPRPAADNIALDDVLLRERGRGAGPNTVRFLQFSPSAALIGYHQCAVQEIRTGYCREHGIDVNRRITGGGAIFFDRTQIGWEIVCDREFFRCGVANVRFFEELCRPVIRALKVLGVKAEFRPRNDIEVRGRKISGTGGTEHDRAFLFQGTLLVDFDVDTMMRALRVPVEKLRERELESIRERVTCLKQETGSVPGPAEIKRALVQGFEKEFRIELVPGGLTAAELVRFKKERPRFRTRAWIDRVRLPPAEQPVITGAHRSRGGLVKAAMIINTRQKRIRSAMITGDFFAYPRRSVFDLESQFKDIPADRGSVGRCINAFFKNRRTEIPGVAPRDVKSAFFRALERLRLVDQGISGRWVNHVFPVNGSFKTIARIRPRNILVPYCAKSRACGYRHRKGCKACGKCSVSDVYGLARSRGMRVTTILSFEDLMDTLGRLRRTGAGSYVGCCCEAFYLKHYDDFLQSKMPGILVDIDNTTCYDLGKAREAYRGAFESETRINVPLLSEVLNAM